MATRGVPTNGERIRVLRRGKGQTQSQFADACGIGERTLQEAERGGPIDAVTVQLIADRLGVPRADLIAAGGAGPDDPTPCPPWDKLLGRWAARIEQPDGPDGRPYRGELTIEFDAPGGGRYAFEFEGTTYDCRFEATWLFERYFKCDARPSAAGGYLFNTAYLQVSPAGDRLAGRYVGFGPHSNGVVCGVLAATKRGRGPADAGG